MISNKLAIKVFEQLEKFAYASASKISVITPSFAKNLKDKGVSNQKMTCISNWVDVSFVKPLPKEDNAFRQTYGLEGKFVVLYSGNIARTQGVRTIIRSAAQLKHNPDIKYVIVGEKRQLQELETLRVELDAHNVLLLPFVAREELPEMLSAADVSLIMQKRNVVGFNMPSKTQVIMASGRPIIASVPSHGAAAEAVRDSGSGLIVEPESPTELTKAIQYLYENPEETQKLGQLGRQYAIDNYSFDQALSSYETLLKSLVKERQPRPSKRTVPTSVVALAQDLNTPDLENIS